ncbi:MAG TPA: hypothetical protein VMT91_08740 [Anaerolineales bacterium]|nr:hypothetical protein [Anaerolineales bacterium]
MKTGSKLNPNNLIKSRISWFPILIVITFLIVRFWWKSLFISGRISGIYWLFVFIDNENYFLLLAGLFAILSFVFFTLFVIKKYAHHGNYLPAGQNSLVFFLCSLTLVLSIFIDLHYETIPVAELNAQGNVYYLAEYREQSIAFDYSLYQCDAYGFLCKRLNPPNLFYDTPDANLIYSQTNHTISIVVFGKGVVYDYTLP